MGRLIPAGTGVPRYREVQVKVAPTAMEDEEEEALSAPEEAERRDLTAL